MVQQVATVSPHIYKPLKRGTPGGVRTVVSTERPDHCSLSTKAQSDTTPYKLGIINSDKCKQTPFLLPTHNTLAGPPEHTTKAMGVVLV